MDKPKDTGTAPPPDSGPARAEPWYYWVLCAVFLFGLVASLATGRLLFLLSALFVTLGLVIGLTFSPRHLGGIGRRRPKSR